MKRPSHQGGGFHTCTHINTYSTSASALAAWLSRLASRTKLTQLASGCAPLPTMPRLSSSLAGRRSVSGHRWSGGSRTTSSCSSSKRLLRRPPPTHRTRHRDDRIEHLRERRQAFDLAVSADELTPAPLEHSELGPLGHSAAAARRCASEKAWRPRADAGVANAVLASSG